MMMDNAEREYLINLLKLDYYLDEDEINSVIHIFEKYMKAKSKKFNSLATNLSSSINFLKALHFDEDEIISIISKNPSLIHCNKKDLLNKYLILALLDYSGNRDLRRKILISRPKDLLIGVDLLYARAMFLKKISQGRNSSYLTANNILKVTNNEFQERFNLSKERLLELYPLDDTVLNEVYSWEKNKKIVETLIKESKELLGGIYAV